MSIFYALEDFQFSNQSSSYIQYYWQALPFLIKNQVSHQNRKRRGLLWWPIQHQSNFDFWHLDTKVSSETRCYFEVDSCIRLATNPVMDILEKKRLTTECLNHKIKLKFFLTV